MIFTHFQFLVFMIEFSRSRMRRDLKDEKVLLSDLGRQLAIFKAAHQQNIIVSKATGTNEKAARRVRKGKGSVWVTFKGGFSVLQTSEIRRARNRTHRLALQAKQTHCASTIEDEEKPATTNAAGSFLPGIVLATGGAVSPHPIATTETDVLCDDSAPTKCIVRVVASRPQMRKDEAGKFRWVAGKKAKSTCILTTQKSVNYFKTNFMQFVRKDCGHRFSRESASAAPSKAVTAGKKPAAAGKKTSRKK